MDQEPKQQFNIYLSPDLIRRVKHASIDARTTLSRFVEDALRTYIAPAVRRAGAPRPGALELMPVIFVSDVPRSIAFYQGLGLELVMRSRSGKWAELRLGDATLALHSDGNDRDESRSDSGRTKLSLVSQEPLDRVRARLTKAGVHVEGDVVDEAFGRSLLIRDPDGLELWINERDAELDLYQSVRTDTRSS